LNDIRHYKTEQKIYGKDVSCSPYLYTLSIAIKKAKPNSDSKFININRNPSNKSGESPLSGGR